MRDRKFAEPAAPNRLPDEPLPNAAPMSAPLPCCSSTKPQIADGDQQVHHQQKPISRYAHSTLLARRRTALDSGRARSPKIPSASSDAPPTSPPSMSGIANSAAALAALTLPP